MKYWKDTKKVSKISTWNNGSHA